MVRKPSDRDLSEETCSTGVRQPRDTALRPLTPISNKDRTDEASKPPPKQEKEK